MLLSGRTTEPPSFNDTFDMDREHLELGGLGRMILFSATLLSGWTTEPPSFDDTFDMDRERGEFGKMMDLELDCTATSVTASRTDTVGVAGKRA